MRPRENQMELATGAYALTTVALFLKMFSTSAVQASGRIGTNTFVNPEDARFYGKTEPAAEEAPLVRRAQAVWRNDLENIPIFLFLGLVYVLARCWPVGAVIYFSSFVVARIFHAVFYFKAMQPWRNISYDVGIVICFVISAHVVLEVL
jgi:uncharacterized membrane protein YecN with MAPEG domain